MLEANWLTVQVYRTCIPQWITGMHKPVYQGLPATEIEAAVRLWRVPADDYDDLLAGLRVMTGIASEIHNART